MSARFTIDGSPNLEQEIGQLCRRVCDRVRAVLPARMLQAIVLGGGYGRGEGGVLATETGDHLYNDIEFYVFVRGSALLAQRRYGKALDREAHSLSSEAGLHVEFKLESVTRFRAAPVSMFSYDLVSAHRTVWGDEAIFHRCEKHRDGSNIPLSEATRLLLNRCTGLLLARELLERGQLTAEDADFVGRNLAKARLALGDALLTAMGLYYWSVLERHNRLAELITSREPVLGENPSPAQAHPPLTEGNFSRYEDCRQRDPLPSRGEISPNNSHIEPLNQRLGISPSPPREERAGERRPFFRPREVRGEGRVRGVGSGGGQSESSPFVESRLQQIVDHHAAGMEFKLHPQRLSKPIYEFLADHEELCSLASEVWLWLESRRLRRNFGSFGEYALSQKPQHGFSWRNYALNARTFGLRALFDPMSRFYPRERLFSSLPLLLRKTEIVLNPELRQHVQRQLRTKASDWTDLVQAYKHVWSGYA